MHDVIAGRPLTVYDDIHNPARIRTGKHHVVMTKFADGELLLEATNKTATVGFRQSTTEADLGHTFPEILQILDGSGTLAIDVANGIGIIVGSCAGDREEFVGIHMCLTITEPADPVAIGLKLLALKARRKSDKLEQQSKRMPITEAQLRKLLSRLTAH